MQSVNGAVERSHEPNQFSSAPYQWQMYTHGQGQWLACSHIQLTAANYMVPYTASWKEFRT